MFKLEFKARQRVEGAARGGGGAASRTRPGSASDAQLQAVVRSDPQIRQQAMLHLRRLLAACE